MNPSPVDFDARLRRAYRLALVLGGTTLAFFLAFTGLLCSARGVDSRSLWSDPEVRREAVRELVAAAGRYDSHPDADVGRVLQPGLEGRPSESCEISSNRWGMREREFSIPKEEDTIRVVLLGDSLVYGLGIDADQRVGVHLERELAKRGTLDGRRVECLHLAIPSWNIVAECAFLRRQLSVLQPDFVIQVIAINDLCDSSGVRGFGAPSGFTAQFRERANGLIGPAFTRGGIGVRIGQLVRCGLDYEGRSRFELASRELVRLADAVERSGAGYLVVNHASRLASTFREYLFAGLDPEKVLYLPSDFTQDLRYQISKTDWHWNAEGCRTMASLLYGYLRGRGSVPALELTPWPEAEELAAQRMAQGREESERPLPFSGKQARSLAREIVFAELDERTARQIHGGVDEHGRLAPYASLLLRRPPHSPVLEVDGQCIERPEIDGELHVFADEVEVAVIDLGAGKPVHLRVQLPVEVVTRPFLSIRFEATDYAYDAEDLRSCVSFRLDRVALVP